MKIFQFIGRLFGKVGHLLIALFTMFDFDELEKGDMAKFIREDLGQLAALLKQRFGRGKIKVTYENIRLLVASLILGLERFGSLQAFHDFLLQAKNAPAEDPQLEQALKSVQMD
jgi:hypothetical protein